MLSSTYSTCDVSSNDCGHIHCGFLTYSNDSGLHGRIDFIYATLFVDAPINLIISKLGN